MPRCVANFSGEGVLCEFLEIEGQIGELLKFIWEHGKLCFRKEIFQSQICLPPLSLSISLITLFLSLSLSSSLSLYLSLLYLFTVKHFPFSQHNFVIIFPSNVFLLIFLSAIKLALSLGSRNKSIHWADRAN